MGHRGTIIFVAATLLGVALANHVTAQNAQPEAVPVRQRLLMDFNWRFALGNADDPAKDFDPANSYFTYLAKAGNGAGAAAADFDDRGWRVVNLPNDWAVALPFSERGSSSHGYKAIGRNFPENSVGWYRKKFFIPASDLGKHITVEFEGVFRDSEVWVNGFYLGRESSGYTSFSYNLTDYLNYGGDNTIAVRANASLEEGWFYEGAGIYRHVWLVVTSPLHVAKWGTFVTTAVKDNAAEVTASVTVRNDAPKDAHFRIEQTILDADGKVLARGELNGLSLKAGVSDKFPSVLRVPNPHLWSLDSPCLHTLVTTIRSGGAVVDRYETPFGIRTIHWDPNNGFFLNGKRVELKGTCNHQDAAGVGVAVPDVLNVYRLEQLKKMGCNAIRTSHNAPAPELLDACDRLGMLVMDENREYGINPQELDELKALILRDRNHPSVIIWSLGNEEWNLEGNERGTRVTQTMQTFAHRLDPTRPCTVAISGGWGQGSSISIDVMGFNYFTHGNNDEYHKQFPNKPSVATEDASTFSTRGVYVEDLAHQHLTAYDTNKPDWGATAEKSWSHYAARPYVAGLFQWTGFDYRGEETPFSWPAISSQFGILDTCGFPKDNFYYYQSWWTDKPVLHVFPHWNWPGEKGQNIDVWVYSNCQEVELFLNGKSLGRKKMTANSHLEWMVKYEPGTLLARGYNDGKEVLTDKIETTGDPTAVELIPDRSVIKADGEDVSVITVQANDAQGRMVPTANNEITFKLDGPGRIIGVGNGDPSSHEPDQYVPSVSTTPIAWRMHEVDSTKNRPEVAFNYDDTNWQVAFAGRDNHEERRGGFGKEFSRTNLYRGVFELAAVTNGVSVSLLLRDLGEDQWIYLNGQPLAMNARRNNSGHQFDLNPAMLRLGKNVVAIIATPLPGGHHNRDVGEQERGGNPAVVKIVALPGNWKRSLFNGLAQVIVQSTRKPGEITLTTSSPGLSPYVLKIHTEQVALHIVADAK